MQPGRILLSCAVLVALGLPAGAAPDEDLLGKAAGYPIGSRTNWFYDERVRVGSFSHLDSILQHYTLKKAASPRPLPKISAEPRIEYRFEQQPRTLDDFLNHQRVTGFLLIRDGEVLTERYQYNRNAEHRFRFAFDGEVHCQHRRRDGAGRKEDRFARRYHRQICA